jgi:hypothetical protein
MINWKLADSDQRDSHAHANSSREQRSLCAFLEILNRAFPEDDYRVDGSDSRDETLTAERSFQGLYL